MVRRVVASPTTSVRDIATPDCGDRAATGAEGAADATATVSRPRSPTTSTRGSGTANAGSCRGPSAAADHDAGPEHRLELARAVAEVLAVGTRDRPRRCRRSTTAGDGGPQGRGASTAYDGQRDARGRRSHASTANADARTWPTTEPQCIASIAGQRLAGRRLERLRRRPRAARARLLPCGGRGVHPRLDAGSLRDVIRFPAPV